MQKVPVRIPQCLGEPSYETVERLAMRHGAFDRDRLPRSLGLDPVRLKHGLECDKVAALLGLDPAQVARATFVRDGGTMRLSGFVVAKGAWGASSKVCLECLREDAAGRDAADASIYRYRRTWWDLRFVGRCERHDRVLVSECHGCGARLRWREGPLLACHACTHPLYEASGATADRADWEAYLVGRLGFGLALPSPILDGLDLADAVTCVVHLGATLGRGRNPSRSFRKAVHAEAGYRLLVDGCTPLRAALAGVRVPSPYLTAKQVRGVLDPLLSWLENNPAASLEPIRRAILDHAARTWILVPGARLLGVEAVIARYGVLDRLGKDLGLDQASLDLLSRHIGIPLSDDREPDAGERSSFEAAARCAMDSVEAARLLGLDSPTLAALSGLGVLPRVEWSRWKGLPVRYDRMAVTALAATLSYDLPAQRQEREGFVSFDDMSFFENGVSRSARRAALVMALISGRVRPSWRKDGVVGAVGLRFADPRAAGQDSCF